MKCPKCGSEVTIKNELYKSIGICNMCGYKIKQRDLPRYKKEVEMRNKEQHQQRLDKVLEKFEKVQDGNYYYYQKLLQVDSNQTKEQIGKMRMETYLYLGENKTQFFLIVDLYIEDYLMTTSEQKRSLDTVESLIKDLESDSQ